MGGEALLLKIILFLIALALLWALWRRPDERGRQSPAESPSEDMVRCAHCGVYLPQSESLAAEDCFYCCEAHRLAGSRKA